MQKEFLDSFEGKKNVWHIISDNGNESWLTQEVSFADETCARGACKLNTVENESKHVLFLFNDKNEEVGRYYIGKSLQGKTPSELVEIKNDLVFFESFNPESKSWVPCVKLSSKGDNFQTYKKQEEDANYQNLFNGGIITKREYIGSYAGKENVVSINNNGLVIYMTSPRSYTMELNNKKAFKMEIYETESNHQLRLLSSNGQIVATYCLSNKLWGINPVSLNIHRYSLGFCDTYDPKLETWIAYVGYKDEVFSKYYDEAIMSFIQKAWSIKHTNEDPNIEFDNALYQRTIEDLVVLKEICFNDTSTITAIKYGILDWDTHVKNANMVCKNFHIAEINMMLTGFEKKLFFWKFLFEEIRNHHKRIDTYFPKEFQSYSEENLKKLIDYYNNHCKYKWTISNVSISNITDPETEIMSALRHGDGDSVGF